MAMASDGRKTGLLAQPLKDQQGDAGVGPDPDPGRHEARPERQHAPAAHGLHRTVNHACVPLRFALAAKLLRHVARLDQVDRSGGEGAGKARHHGADKVKHRALLQAQGEGLMRGFLVASQGSSQAQLAPNASPRAHLGVPCCGRVGQQDVLGLVVHGKLAGGENRSTNRRGVHSAVQPC